ncbi:MAG: choice-of-anchor D domain-containing protein, partial [Caulobacterales bacterium]|nr:choice-of-anchor D domain-containing protein [Caulobacterales bacterium]
MIGKLARRTWTQLSVGALAGAMMAATAPTAAQAQGTLSGFGSVGLALDRECVGSSPTEFSVPLVGLDGATNDAGGGTSDQFFVALIDPDNNFLGARFIFVPEPGGAVNETVGVSTNFTPSGTGLFTAAVVDIFSGDPGPDAFEGGQYPYQTTPTASTGQSVEIGRTTFDATALDPDCLTTQPEIEVTGNGNSIGNGATTSSASNGTLFDPVAVGGSSTAQTFVITNPGDANLTIDNIVMFSTGTTTGTNYTLGGTTSGVVTPGNSIQFTVTFSPTTPGTLEDTVRITSDGVGNELYRFEVEGVGEAAEIAVSGNGNDITDGDTDPAAADGTLFGDQDVGTSSSPQTFVINNTGTGSLDITAITLANDTDFALGGGIVGGGAIAAGGSQNFTVTFSPTAPGNLTDTVSIANSDADENPFTFTVGGGASGVEIDVTGNGQPIGDGTTTTSAADDTDFGQQAVGDGPVQRTFTIVNSGNTALTISSITLDSGAQFSLGAAPASVAAGESETFTVSFDPDAAGNFVDTVSIANDDLDENPYTFAVGGQGTAPDINVLGDGMSITDGDSTPTEADGTSFGSVTVASGSAANSFTLQNDGDAPLTIASVAVSGDAAGDFTPSGFTSGAIAAGASQILTITFDPSAAGARTGTVAIASDDPDESPFTFAVEGVGLDQSAPTLAASNPVVATPATLEENDDGGTLSLAVTFSEAMNPSVLPTVSFPNEDPTNTLTQQGNGAFSSGNTVFTVTYGVTDVDDVIANIDVRVQGGEDAAGNAFVSDEVMDVFSINMPDTETPRVVSLEANPSEIDESDVGAAGFQIALVFSEPMNTAIAPTVTFPEEDPTGTISAPSGVWTQNGTVYTLSYTVAASNTELANVDVRVSGAEDLIGITMVEFNQADAFDIDTVEESITVDPELTLALDLPLDPNAPAEDSGVIPLVNESTLPQPFDASTDVEWLTLSSTTGVVPPANGGAPGSFDLTVSLNDDTDALPSGPNVGTVSIVEGAAIESSGGLTTAAAGDPIATITVILNVEQRDGTITIMTTTSPDEAGDDTFTYASGASELDGLSITTENGMGDASGVVVRNGVFSLQQNPAEGWLLQSLVCTGDEDGGTSIDTATNTANIDLDPDEAITCVFANARDAEFVQLTTRRVIRSYMAQRADRILAASPRVIDRLRREDRGGPTGGFAMTASEGQTNMSFAASLADVRRAQQRRERRLLASLDGQPVGMGDSGGSLQLRDGDGAKFDVWVQGSFASATYTRSGGVNGAEFEEDSDFAIVHVGADYLLNPNLIVGGMFQYDSMDMTSGDLGSTVDGSGWMIGPYVAARVLDNIYLDARFAWGKSSNDINPLGSYTDSFDTTRSLIEANVTGDYYFDKLRVSPRAGVAQFSEESDAYTDSLGLAIPSESIDIGRLTLGPEIAYRFERGESSYIEPTAELVAVIDYDEAEILTADGELTGQGGTRGTIRLGLNAALGSA